ncbi:MAG: hypothetical protein ACOC2W_00020 [bacterium]
MSRKENLKQLQELIRKVDQIVNKQERDSTDLTDFHSDSNWFRNKDIHKKLYETNPECYVSVTLPGRNPALLPICNRTSVQDPQVIAMSMKAVKKLNKLGKCDKATRDVLLAKLVKLQKRLDREDPKPYSSSSRKAKLTKYMNNMKSQLEKIKNQ